MLDKFKKFFKEEVKEMTVEQDKPEMASNQEAEAALSALQASFDEQGAALQAALAQVEDLKTQMSQFAEQAAAAKLAADEAIAKAHKEKMDARFAQMSAELGDDKATKLMSVVEKMDDTEFAEVFGVQKELTAKVDETFAEQGVDAKVQEEKKPIHFKNFIKGNK